MNHKLFNVFLSLFFTVFSSQFLAAKDPGRVTVDVDKGSLKELFTQIERQTNYVFSYRDELVKKEKHISIKLKNSTVANVLNKALGGTNLNYQIVSDNSIIIKEKKLNKTASGTSLNEVSGTVLDDLGEPITGAIVTVKGTSLATSTDANGFYILRNVPENAELVFSYIGTKSKTIPANESSQLANVTLNATDNYLDEIVVVGFGVQKKANLTGATATINKDQFKPRGVTSTSQYLQGAAANLNITNNDGGPGQEPSINIRGYSGLGTSYSPLIIVDGFASSLKELNPNDIESISILKDASAAAIYGAQAAYGVVLITTKSGGKNTKASITYSNNISYSTPIAFPKTAGSIEFADLMREASLNEGGTGIFSEQTLQRIEQYYHSPGSIPNTIPQPGNPNNWANWGDGNCNANEDWFKELFKSQVNQMHNIEISGGSNTTTYQMSLGFLRDEGKLRLYDDNYTKYNANLKINTDVTKWLTVGMNMRYVKEKTVLPSYYFSSTVNSLFGWAAMMWPTQPIRDPNGHFTSDGRMAFLHDANPNKAEGDKFVGNLSALFKIVPGLTINAGLSYNKYAFKQTSSKGLIYKYGVDNVPVLDGGSEPSTTQVWQSAENQDYITGNVYITYEKSIKDHNFKVMAGTQMEYLEWYRLAGNKTHLLFPDVPSIATSIGTPSVNDGLDHWTTLGYFGRINYDYAGKYLLEFNLRRDGSSRYADKSVPGSSGRWGTFPSVSGGWNLAKESFLNKYPDILNELKIRASYGELGNMRGKSYQYISTIDYQQKYGYIMDGKQISAFGWPSMSSFNTWEKNRTLDFGLDVSMLRNRLTFSADYYLKDILGLITQGELLPAVLGANTPDQNCTNIRNTGFEISVSWNDQFNINGKPFRYNVTAMLSDYVGKVTKYSNPKGIFGNWDGGVPRIWTHFYEGAKMGEIWGYETDHMIKTQEEADMLNETGAQSHIGHNWSIGDIMYKDLNDDGKITDGEMTLDNPGDLKVIGNNTPRYKIGRAHV